MRVSRGRLIEATEVMQKELEERILEGFWARVKRYLTDKDLAKRWQLAKAAERNKQ